MSDFAADYRKIVQIALPLIAALFLAWAGRFPAQAATAKQDGHMLMIPASDGYGFDDCLSGNKACGHTIADAWCEAHGMSAALSFGRAEDITASIPQMTASDAKPAVAQAGGTSTAMLKLDPGSFVVNCKD